MQNSDQIKEASDPAHEKRSRQIFQNFTDATVALLDSPECPSVLKEALSDAFEDIGNTTGAHDEYAGEYARRMLSNTFNLTDEEPTKDADEADIAAMELANAFAAIEEYRDYIPARTYNEITAAITDWVLNDNHFISNPKMMRAGLPGILREIIAAEAEEETA